MNANGSHPGPDGHARPENPHVTGQEVSLEHGHVAGVATADRFDNPGLPPHKLRHADVDPKAAKRAERQVATMFGLSILGTLGFLVAYFAIPMHKYVWIPWFGNLDLLHTLFGVFLGLSLLGIGLGAVHWAKTLMPDTEVVEERHPIVSSAENRQGVIDTLGRGAEQSQIARRPLIKVAGGTALGIFALPMLVQLIGGLGKMGDAQEELRHTFWRKGLRLMTDPENRPIKASDVTMGSVYHVLPEGIHDNPKQKPDEGQTFQHDEQLGVLERKAKAAVLLMRLDPASFVNSKARDWGYHGIVAYSKICTHAGCPVGLYEQQTHHLLCPCHQSTFDVTNDCEVIFGPARRALPQLKITVDKDGYLIADDGFAEPVGPSFWTRKR
ncbi:MAG: Rieske (2Fe-2S) protein [Austwickia sp.]|jgi:ubiquinol-cytochrome c reductase iron-sulfur subunit|nr:MAG: Rieske (2Fe-2S) protein [Austwickia sp.]